MPKITDMPVAARPRERFLRKGPGVLSNSDLLAIVLGSGGRGNNVKRISNKIIRKFGENSLRMSVEELQEIDGIGPAKALQIAAMAELIKRCRGGGGINGNGVADIADKRQTMLFDMMGVDGALPVAELDVARARREHRFRAPQVTRGRFQLQSRRYIGNKHKLTDWIFSVIDAECAGASFMDVFAGTGVVAAAAIPRYKTVIVNDFLHSNHVIYDAFFGNGAWSEVKLQAIVKEYNNLNGDDLPENYFSANFGGKYFSNGTAKVIGFVRENIADNRANFTDKEHSMLLASLLYSADKVANTVGHYDAYFKKKTVQDNFYMRLIEPLAAGHVISHREDANMLVRRIRADIAYIDPPYNSRQYSRFYHLLENLTQWNKPKLHGVALKPEAENMSDYCRVGARAKFADLVAHIDAKHLVVSYNNTYESKSSSSQNKITLHEIRGILEGKGRTKVFEKRYRHFNAGNTDFSDHKEYLFVTTTAAATKPARKPKRAKMRRSPLYYVGDKYRLMAQLSAKFPAKIRHFYEPFVGGGSVFMNVEADKYFVNDVDRHLISIHKYLASNAGNPARFFAAVDAIVRAHGLSRSHSEDVVPAELKAQYKKTYYAKFNKAGYEKLRERVNGRQKNDPLILYVLLIYGFNRMLRFNGEGKFNLPVGNVDFNANVVNALNDYFAFVKGRAIRFTAKDFRRFFDGVEFGPDDFVYLDPPYLIAASEYNKLWNAQAEADLLALMDGLNDAGVKFALSNVTHYNGAENRALIRWMQKYAVHEVRSNYINYHDNSRKNIREVLVVNY